MKKLLIVSLFLSLSSVDIFASGNMDHSKMDHSKMSSRKKIDESTKKSVIKALDANEELHNSFFDYNGKKIEDAAKNLKAAVLEIKNEEIAKLLKFSTTKLELIKESAKRSDNNDNYHLVSMALIHVVNTYDLGSKYNAYSCPMVKKKWLQNSQKDAKVNNPYAPNMPHCGSQDTNY